MPKIVTPNSASAIQLSTGANYYRFIGIEFFAAPGIYIQDVIQVGVGAEPSTDQLPHDIDFDRVYVHADASAGGKRGIALNGGATTVENSYVSGFWSTWQDTQALCGWNGPGPYTITNNYLEAGTEIVAFGGAIPSIPGVIPSNILIQGNLFFKPLSWMAGSASYAGIPVWVKNDIELKNAQNITIDSNDFENNWKGADQRGYFLLFNVRTESHQVPWAVVNNVKVTNNIFRHSAAGLDITGHDDDGAGSATNFLVQNNVWDDINGNWGSDGRWFQLTTGANNVTIDHNTVFQTGFILGFDVGQEYNVNATNNIVLRGGEITGNGAGYGSSALNAYDIGGVFANNVVVGADPNIYPAGNLFPSSIDQVGFVNYAAGDYRLASNSPYKNAGTDAKDLGANLTGTPGTTSAPAAPASVAPPANPTPPSSPAPPVTPDPSHQSRAHARYPFFVGERHLEKQREVPGCHGYLDRRVRSHATVGLLGRRQPEIPLQSGCRRLQNHCQEQRLATGCFGRGYLGRRFDHPISVCRPDKRDLAGDSHFRWLLFAGASKQRQVSKHQRKFGCGRRTDGAIDLLGHRQRKMECNSDLG